MMQTVSFVGVLGLLVIGLGFLFHRLFSNNDYEITFGIFIAGLFYVIGQLVSH